MAFDTHHITLLLSDSSCVASTVCAAALAVPETECVSGDVTLKKYTRFERRPSGIGQPQIYYCFVGRPGLVNMHSNLDLQPGDISNCEAKDATGNHRNPEPS